VAGRPQRKKEFRERHRQLGLCVECTQPAEVGKSLCPRHRQNQKERSLAYIASKRVGAIPSPLIPGRVRFVLEDSKAHGVPWAQAWNRALAVVLQEVPSGWERRSWRNALLWSRRAWEAAYHDHPNLFG
jgi:hypothetical protein